MVLDSQVQTPSGCRLKMRLSFERSAEAFCFLPASRLLKHWALKTVLTLPLATEGVSSALLHG